MRYAGQHLVAWKNQPQPAGFPLHAQAAPLHRAQVPLRGDDLIALALPGDAWVIDTRTLRGIPTQAMQIARCDAHLITRIEATVLRAIAAEHAEAKWLEPQR